MAVNSKAIKQRIKSVKNTKKMTKAMEMVSAAKMRKAVQGTLATRSYAVMARELMEALSAGIEVQSPLLEYRPVARLLVVLISSNRGLCGSFNANIFKKARQILREKQSLGRHRTARGETIEPAAEIAIDILGVGKKSAWFARQSGYPLVAAFDELSERPTFEEIIPITRFVMDAFSQKTYDKVAVLFTDYKSSLAQEVKVRQLLPISAHDLEKMLRDSVGDAGDPRGIDSEHYVFEPSPSLIVQTVLPRLAEVQLYQGILESAASEHSARMVAMKSATEAAGEMIDMLTLEFNKARQASITQEIAEIAGGAAAL